MLGHEMLFSTLIGGLGSLKFRFSQPQPVKESLR